LKIRFIVNPRSGRAARALGTVRAYADAQGASLVLTENSGHARSLAEAAIREGDDLIVAVGGDGTMNEVASALVGTAATFGLIPCGSGNGLGRHLRIHGSVAEALRILTEGTPRLIDTGLADGRPFFTAAGLGFEAEIAQRFNRLERRGFLRYLTTSAQALRHWESERVFVTHADGREELTAFTLVVANASQYGNNAHIAPRAEVDDGLLNLCVVPPITLVNAPVLLTRLFAGTLDRSIVTTQRCAPYFLVERESTGPIHTDGEIHEAGRSVEFTVRPASLKIMAPRVDSATDGRRENSSGSSAPAA
jgi:diacylglycerol kinase (ATP)